MRKFILKFWIALIVILQLIVFLDIDSIERLAAQSSENYFSTVISKEDLNIDTSLEVANENFQQPQSILVAPLVLDSDSALNSEEWYRGLYYYFSSDRFNFKDIPAHYIVADDGKVFEGTSGGVEQTVLIEDGPVSPILVFYLSSGIQNSFSVDGKTALQELLIRLANENRVESEDISLQRVDLEIDRDAGQVNLRAKEIFGSWNIDFSEIQDTIAENYNPRNKTYAVEIVETNLPEGPVTAGSEVVAEVTLRNNGQNTIFENTDSILIYQATSGDSPLFVNETWLSRSEIGLLDSGEYLRPGTEKTFSIRLNVALGPNRTISDSFRLVNGYGQTFENTDINVRLSVTQGDKRLVEILNTETGTLNVRDNPGIGGALLTRVSPGEYYELIGESGSWYQIRVQGDTGWVSSRYARVI